MSKYGKPQQIVTEKCPSYKAALKEINMQNLQETKRYSNNKVENFHLHFRRREKMMNRFRSMRSLQKFTSIQFTFLNHFSHQRHLKKRAHFKELRQVLLNVWNGILVA